MSNDEDLFGAPAVNGNKKNIYDDILHGELDVNASQPSAPLPPELVKPVYTQAPDMPPPQADSALRDAPVRRRADRHKPISERGKIVIREREQEKQKVPRPFIVLIIGVVVTLAVIATAIIYVVTNKSEVGETPDSSDGTVSEAPSDALLAVGLNGIPDGFTGQQILDLPRLEDVETELNEQASDFIGRISFAGDFTKGASASLPIPDADGNPSPIWSAGSDVYYLNASVSSDDVQKMVDVANEGLTKLGFSETELVDDGSGVFHFGSAMSSEDTSLRGYSVVIDNGTVSGNATVTVTFFSQPHIKKGAEIEFEEYVTKIFRSS